MNSNVRRIVSALLCGKSASPMPEFGQQIWSILNGSLTEAGLIEATVSTGHWPQNGAECQPVACPLKLRTLLRHRSKWSRLMERP